MKYTQLFFDGNNKLLAEIERDDYFLHGVIASPFSELLFCDTCGDVFARMPVIEKATGKIQPWASSRLRCSKCPSDQSRFLWAGSMLLAWDSEFLKIFPEVLWQREAEIHMNIYEDFIKEI